MTRYLNETEDEDQFDERGILEDGAQVTVPMFCMDTLDANGNVIETRAQVLDSSIRFHDGLGRAVGNRPGYVCRFEDEPAAKVWNETRDFQKAKLSAEWKGGLEDGDIVPLNGRNMQVVGFNSETGKVRLANTRPKPLKPPMTSMNTI